MKVAPEPGGLQEEAAGEDGTAQLYAAEDPKDVKKRKLGVIDKIDICIDKACGFGIMDIIEDDCRVRLANVWIFLLIFVFFVMGLLHIARRTEPVLSRVGFAAAPPQSVVSGVYPIEHARTPKVVVSNDNGSPRVGVEVTPHVLNFRPMFKLIPCGTIRREKIRNTLEALRHEEVCRYQESGKGTTGKLGLGKVEGLGINGPSGIYRVGAKAMGMHGDITYNIVVRTKVHAMYVMDPENISKKLLPPVHQVPIGQPLEKQPVILLHDAEGMPVSGVEVIAFSNQDSVWPPDQEASRSPSYNRQGQKLSELGCSRSLPSDSDGYANFECLKVLGSTSHTLNIIFTVGSAVFLPWNDPLYSFANVIHPTVQIYRYSMWLASEVKRVEVVVAPPQEIEEGEEFPNAVQVRVSGSSGNLAGVTCYALIVSERGLIDVLRFRRQLVGTQHKELLNPKSNPSNDGGIATFNKLGFSAYGNTQGMPTVFNRKEEQSFGLRFVCNGVESNMTMVNIVKTRVAEVRIKRYVKKTAYVSKLGGTLAADGSDTFVVIIRVVDKDGYGVAGKTVRLDSSTVGAFQLESTTETTKKSGFTVFAFQVVFGNATIATTLTEQFTVKFRVDGESVMSENFTLNARTPPRTDTCNTLVIARAKMKLGATWETLDITDQVPTIPSGQLILLGVYVITSSLSVPFTISRRRLQEELVNETRDRLEVGRRLIDEMDADTLQKAPRRRLITGTDQFGTLTITMEQAYSNEGRLIKSPFEAPTLVTPFEPTFTEASFIELDEFPSATLSTLGTYNGYLELPAIVNGANGSNWLRLTSSFSPAGTDEKEYCYSPPFMINIVNPIVDIKASLRGASDDLSRFTFAEAQAIIIDVVFEFCEGCPIPGKPNSGFAAVHLNDWANSPGALTQDFIEVPMLWQVQVGNGFFNMLNNNGTETSTFEAYKLEESEGIVYGKMALKLKFKLEGLFGYFAIQFSSAGSNSNPILFEVSDPPNLAMEVLREPSMAGQAVINTQDVIPVTPIIKITSDGRPIEGAIAFIELIPNNASSQFTKITDFPLYDALQGLYSTPSGYNFSTADKPNTLIKWKPGGCLYGYYCLTDWTGVSVWSYPMLYDGFGAGKMRFWLSTTSHAPGLYPSDHDLNFRAAIHYEIHHQPPPSMPLEMRMDELRADPPLTVHAIFPHGFTDLAAADLGIVRFSVAKYNGNIVSRGKAFALSKNMFDNVACLWISGMEIGYNCGPLKVLPGPKAAVSFTVTGLTWRSLEEVPTTVNLLASDFTGTPLLSNNIIEKPPGMSSWPEEKQNEYCITSAINSLDWVPTSSTMVPEVQPASAVLVIAPPDIIEVGAMFLVRLMPKTASGGTLQRREVMAEIVATAALKPDLSGGTILQQLGEFGNSLKAVAVPNVRLDPNGTRSMTDTGGVASFPMTILEAYTGEYQLKFQSDSPSSQVLFTTPSFNVINPIASIGSVENWETVEVEDFDSAGPIPKQLKFKVSVSENRTLENLIASGFTLQIRLKLKGISPKVEKQIKLMKEQSQKVAESQVDKVASVGKQIGDASAEAVGQVLVAQLANKAERIFSRMSTELQLQCLKHQMGAVVAKAANETLTRNPEIADAVRENPDVLNPSETLTQFVRTFTGAGQQMALSSSMRVQLDLRISIDDLEFLGSQEEGNNVLRSTYKVKRPIDFLFVEDGQYAWDVAINGVASEQGAFESFIALKVQLTPWESAWEMLVSSLVLVIGCILLMTNTNKYHFAWFALAIPATICVMIFVPTMESYKDAMLKKWPIIAEICLCCLLLSLFWGLGIELVTRLPALADVAKKAKYPKPFGHRRIDYFEAYTRRRLLLLISQRADADGRPLEPHAATLKFGDFCKQMIKPFNEHTAFYFPSQMWVGFGLSMFSFSYALIRSIRFVQDIDDTLMALVNKAIDAVIMQINTIEETFMQVSLGAQLPDSATKFMLTQIELVRDWFENLVSTIKIGFSVGVVVAALLTMAVQFHSFYQFRRWCLLLRNGECAWGKRADGAVVYDSLFMGQYVATTLVGFVLIIIVIVLLAIPFHFEIVWNIIWAALPTILLGTVLPLVLNKIFILIVKKLIFNPMSIKHRAAASIYMFWQLWLSILGGFMSALVRAGIALGGSIIALPTPALVFTNEVLNKIMLLDAPYKTYLAAIMMHHCHNHPVVIYVSRALSYFLAQRKKLGDHAPVETIRAAARKRAHRWVILLLIAHPELRHHRKHAIAARKRQQQEEKELRRLKSMAAEDKLRPPKDVADIKAAIIRHHGEGDELDRRLRFLEHHYFEIRNMPEGPQRQDALKKLVAHDLVESAKSPYGSPRSCS